MMTIPQACRWLFAALCLNSAYMGLIGTATAQSTESDRLPPTISHDQTIRLFKQQKFAQAFKAALHRFEWGDDELHYEIGMMYRNGWGTPRNLYKARNHLKLSANSGAAHGQYQYAEMLRFGQGGNLDLSKACKLYDKAQSINTNAGFQSALCKLKTGDIDKGLKRLHQVALTGHLPATKRLRSHYEQNKPDAPPTSIYYARATRAWAKQDFVSAQALSKKAISVGDYRAYAVLGESQRATTKAKEELVENQVEIGQLFGSALPQFAAGQRLLDQGHAKPACHFFLQSYQIGFQLAGIGIARCLNEGHIAAQANGPSACDYISSSFEAGLPQSARAWLQCQLKQDSPPATLARAYVRSIELDNAIQDNDLARRICDGLPTHTLALGSTIKLHNNELQHVTHPAIDVCELERDANTIIAFAPQTGWLAKLTAYELTLPVVRYGLELETLSRDRLRKLLNGDRIELMPISLTPQRDRLRRKSTSSIEMLIDYNDIGEAIRIVESCKRCGMEHFEQRAKKLSLQLGDALTTSHSDSFASRSWQIQNWDIKLMLKREDLQMRQIFTKRNKT